MNRGNLADLTAFIAVADHLSFRAAASRLGVTPSALSHSMRQLEERLGVRLLHRTTRSVSATDAGMRLLEGLRPAIDQIAGALENLNRERQRPLGRLRIYASHFAAAAVVAPVWGRFLSTYPEIHLELQVGEAPIDIVAKGFDAGIGTQDRAATDMIVVRVTGPLKVVVVGAPSYSARLAHPTISSVTAVSNTGCGATAPYSSGRSSGTAKHGRSPWRAALWSAFPIWPSAQRSMDWGSRTQSKLTRNRSCARGSWSVCWKIGRQ